MPSSELEINMKQLDTRTSVPVEERTLSVKGRVWNPEMWIMHDALWLGLDFSQHSTCTVYTNILFSCDVATLIIQRIIEKTSALNFSLQADQFPTGPPLPPPVSICQRESAGIDLRFPIWLWVAQEGDVYFSVETACYSYKSLHMATFGTERALSLSGLY